MGKNLILYYSTKEKTVSGKIKRRMRDTENLANWIQEAVGGDLFQVEAKKEYPEDLNAFLDILKGEDWHNIRPDAREYLKDMHMYDTIFVGYPNWAGIVPTVIYTFLENYSLVGRKICPFGINEVPEFPGNIVDLKKSCSGAVIEDALFVPAVGKGSYKKRVCDWAVKCMQSGE